MIQVYDLHQYRIVYKLYHEIGNKSIRKSLALMQGKSNITLRDTNIVSSDTTCQRVCHI